MRKLRYLQAVQEAIREEMERDHTVIVLGEDVRQSLRGATKGLVNKFGTRRVLDTPISEAAFTGVATGAALAGLRPVVEYQISALVYVSFDQLVNQAQKLTYMTGGQRPIPVTYIVPGSGARVGLAGQHSDHPYPYFLQAGIKTIIPSTPYDAKGLVTSAIREDDPVMVFLPASVLPVRGEVPEDEYTIPLGVGDIKREGDDVTVIATGHLVYEALAVAEELQSEGISVEVYDPRTLLPLDKNLLFRSVRKTGRVIMYDDSNWTCGFAAEVAALLSEAVFADLKAPIKRVTRADVPVPFSAPMERFVLPTPDRLRKAIRSLLG
ncbi:MAG: alpha-ketoacid dehydrogenase subunit beta [Alicyclobacillus sp.]|nr:alpha-ketoacid dehydrogenase subunit beta [Alicyclobacillus sp.]